MKICGLQKTTLLDFPGYVAATVFISGCNFRCPFCHNSKLLTDQAQEIMSAKELLFFLEKRKGILEGVCITGGEPTLYEKDLETLLRSIKELGYLIKLDTNGTHPKLLKYLWGEHLLDYIAMDIKAGRFHYLKISGTSQSSTMNAIEESISWLMQNHMPYEFRTTVVKGLHTAEDFIDISKWIGGCSQYFLQGFVDSGNVLKKGCSAYDREEMNHFLSIVQETIPQAEIRGMDY